MLYFRLLLIMIFFFVPGLSQSQSGLLPVFKDGHWSVSDTGFHVLYPFIYDDIRIGGNKTVLAKKEGKYFILHGDNVVSPDDDYEFMEPFGDDYFLAKKMGLFGLTDLRGKNILGCLFLSISQLNKHLAITKSDRGFQYFHFSESRLSHAYDSIAHSRAEYFLLYKNGLVSVLNSVSGLKTSGFKEINQVHLPYFFCTASDGNKYVVGFRDKFQSRETDFFYFQGTDPSYLFYRIRGKLLAIERQTQKESPIDAETISRLELRNRTNTLGNLFEVKAMGLFTFTKNGKTGLMDEKFLVLMAPYYDKIDLAENTLNLLQDGKKGMATLNGEIIVPAEYDDFTAIGNYWKVKKGKNYGIVGNRGVELIPPVYQDIEPVLSNKFIVKQGNKKGLVDERGRPVLAIEHESVVAGKSSLVIKKNGKYGLADENGRILLPVRYANISVLNDYYFIYTESNKSGIINEKGRILFQPLYAGIQPAGNPHLFFVEGTQACYDDKETLTTKYGLDPSVFKGVFKENRFKTGVINSYGQILLDTLYDPYQIISDFEGNSLIVKEADGVIVIGFNKEGRLLEKTRYRNYIAVKKDNRPEGTDSLPFYWKRGQPDVSVFRYGLFHTSGRQVLPWYFKNAYTAGFNPELSITVGPEDKYGIVSRKTGKMLLNDVYDQILVSDFSRAQMARLYRSNGLITLINSQGMTLERGISYMDDFRLNFIRVNKGGRPAITASHPHMVFAFPGNNSGGVRNNLPENSGRYYYGGKWGVMDLSGNYTIKPKYEFLQIFFNNMFIASYNGKWGAVGPHDEPRIEFKYDEIRHLYDTAQNYWSNSPYLKVKLGRKWGIIDTTGKTIIPAEFDGIEPIFLRGRYYFKTMMDYSATPAGLVDESGKLLLMPAYPFIGAFKNGFARVQLTDKCWKFINYHLEIFPELCFTEIHDYNNGMARVKTRDGYGFIDEMWQIQIPCQYSEAGDFHEGYARVLIKYPSKLLNLIKAKRSWAIIDKKGEIVYNARAEYCSNVNKGQVVVKKHGKYTLRTLKGKKVLPDNYSSIMECNVEGLYIVKDHKDRSALFNDNGNMLLPFGKYENYAGFSEGLCYVSGSSNGFIDTSGQFRFSFSCDETNGFSEGLAAVRIGKKWGYIDTLGRWVIEAEYIDAQNFKNDFARVKTDFYHYIDIDKQNNVHKGNSFGRNQNFSVVRDGNFVGLTTTQGQITVLPVADEISLFSGGYATIKLFRLFGVIDYEGKPLANPEYPLISITADGFIKLISTNEIRYLK